MKIYKYVLPVDDHIEIEMPVNAEILSFQCQHDVPAIWALVDPDAPLKKRKFRFVGTGHELGVLRSRLKFIGTAQMYDGDLIWHLFEFVG